MDISFINTVDTIMIKMCCDGKSVHIGFEGDINPSDENVKFVGDLLIPFAKSMAQDVDGILKERSVKDDVTEITFMLELETMYMELECCITGGIASSEFKQCMPMIEERSKIMFLDILDELDGVSGVLHQRIAPTFKFIVSKEEEEVA